MNVEILDAIASIGTFVVITVTAIAALIQLRHMRSANQLAGLLQTVNTWESASFQEKKRWVKDVLPAKLKENKFMHELRSSSTLDRLEHPELAVCDLWEQTGCYVKHGIISEEPFLDLCAAQVAGDWNMLVPVVGLRREAFGDAAYENFEYLAARAFAYQKHNPTNYPSHTPRLLPPSR